MKFKLTRAIISADGAHDVNEVNIKDSKDVTAYDFFGMKISADGTSGLGAMADPIANLTGLTEEQVASLSPKDFLTLSAEVGKFLE